MLRAYRYLFYRIYVQQLRWKGWWDRTPEFSAYLLTTGVTFINFLTLVVVVESSFRRSFLPRLSNLQSIALAAVVALPQYFILVYRGRYLQIAHEFQNETPRQRHVRGILLVVYVIGSWVLLWCVSVIRSNLIKP